MKALGLGKIAEVARQDPHVVELRREMRVVFAEQGFVEPKRLAIVRRGGREVGPLPGEDGEIVERQGDIARRRLRLAAQQRE